MDAAMKVMRRNGFQGASVQDILDDAGLSTRAFYRQFQSKDDLLLAMFHTASGPDVEQVQAAVDGAGTAIDGVLAWIDELQPIASARRRIQRMVVFNVVSRQTVGCDVEVASLQDRLLPPLLRAVQCGSEDGS